jgi:hypothetical protein
MHPDGTRHAASCGCSDWWPRCLEDADLEARGLRRDERGWWVRDTGPLTPPPGLSEPVSEAG